MRRGQVRERRFERDEKFSALLDEPLQPFERERAPEAELARARAAECGEVRARPEVFADRLGQRADVSPGGADDARAQVARPVCVRMKKTPVFVNGNLELAHAD